MNATNDEDDLVSRVWKRTEIKGPTFRILLALAKRAEADGVGTALIAELIRETRVMRTRVFILMQKLQEAGEIQIFGYDEGQDTVRFRVLLGKKPEGETKT